ncbi:hypothetical protein JVT61DRAFT_4271 [Boletus reticuloceps]|uniref:Uncharacterized protein n=1 Tax=Boletus reticuloceps TaxID=495285 RepID=A0A8I2YKU9_9AGAM|nr:hypothetical protein JVT61DRAFT_4271 [Boletus reticuloceps]
MQIPFRGCPVLVPNFEDSSSFQFSKDGLLRSMGISSNMLIDMHDAAICIADFAYPHLRGTMSGLIAGINDPSQCRFTLDIPLTQRAMASSISMLDDGLTVGWSQTQCNAPFDKRKVYVDNLAVRGWGLGHQAGVFTHPHQDADGDATYMVGRSGLKIWSFYFLRDSIKPRDEILHLVTELITM